MLKIDENELLNQILTDLVSDRESVDGWSEDEVTTVIKQGWDGAQDAVVRRQPLYRSKFVSKSVADGSLERSQADNRVLHYITSSMPSEPTTKAQRTTPTTRRRTLLQPGRNERKPLRRFFRNGQTRDQRRSGTSPTQCTTAGPAKKRRQNWGAS